MIDQNGGGPNRLDASVHVPAAMFESNMVQLMQEQPAPNMSLGSQVSHTRRE
jgi:hypothetical protein